jgi:hypothetical protein
MASEPTFGPPPDPNAVTGASDAPLDVAHRTLPAISGYEILGELGRGAMGVVYHAREVRLNRPCAIKMILAGGHASPEAATRFLAEAEAVARLHHPNVVQIHRIGEAGGLPFLELEYVEGGSLAAALDGTPWPAKRAAALVELLARAIAAAHGHGLVHRDLKPGNVLVSVDGTPKIIDFGLARMLAADSRLTATGSVLGTPSYMAPEQAAGRTKEVGPAADIYALGAIFYELLTGRPPFRAPTALQTLEQVKSANPVAPSRLVPSTPRDAETIALKCLQKEPGRRYAAADELAEDLRRFRAGEPIRARRVRTAERLWLWSRRNPVVAGLTGSVAVLVVAVAIGSSIAAVIFNRQAQANRRQAAALAFDRGLSLCGQSEPGQGLLWFARALQSTSSDEEGRKHVLSINLAGWSREVHHLRAILPHDPRPRPSTRQSVQGVLSVAFSPDGRIILTGSPDGVVRRWDGTTGEPIGPPLIHPGTVRGVAFGPDGSIFLSGSGAPGTRASRGRPESGRRPRVVRGDSRSPPGPVSSHTSAPTARESSLRLIPGRLSSTTRSAAGPSIVLSSGIRRRSWPWRSAPTSGPS